ncbi:hypothetical protein DAEQUDRAFT_741195 [Daedalea quercina L-15889]|uniref:Uncharacterized protein n=1 Tax=Daedalea quercina L-15889 TaxID=1314783 RepID=A0A165LM35_9APHY|nr:hypothetical protein DAEQUDRAFT_741195 [Daedalea quercina L-15889]
MTSDTPLRRSILGQQPPSHAPLQEPDIAYMPSGEPTYERDAVPSDVSDGDEAEDHQTGAATEESSGGEGEDSCFAAPLNDLDASEEEEIAPDEDEDELESATPRERKRGVSTPRIPRTPRKARTTKQLLAQPTPHSKAALRKRRRIALAVPPPP